MHYDTMEMHCDIRKQQRISTLKTQKDYTVLQDTNQLGAATTPSPALLLSSGKALLGLRLDGRRWSRPQGGRVPRGGGCTLQLGDNPPILADLVDYNTVRYGTDLIHDLVHVVGGLGGGHPTQGTTPDTRRALLGFAAGLVMDRYCYTPFIL